MNELLVNSNTVQAALLLGQMVGSLNTTTSTQIALPQGAEPSDMIVVVYHRLHNRTLTPQPGWNKAFQTVADSNNYLKEVYWCLKGNKTSIEVWNNTSIGTGFDHTALLVRGFTGIKAEHQFQFSNANVPTNFVVPYLNSFLIASGRSYPPVVTGPAPDSSFTGTSLYFSQKSEERFKTPVGSTVSVTCGSPYGGTGLMMYFEQ